jgi:hypothetical protein
MTDIEKLPAKDILTELRDIEDAGLLHIKG